MKRILMGLVLVLVSTPSLVWAWDAFPSLAAGSHYAGSGRWSTSQNVEQCLSKLSASSDANYFAAIVDNTSKNGGSSDNDAVPYVDALSEAWSSQIRPDIDIVIVLGIDNRAVAVHPGSTWARVGFETNEIKATIDGSNFKSFARSQDYAGAICNLGEAVERRVSSLVANQETVLKAAQGRVDSYRTRIPMVRAQVKAEVKDVGALSLAYNKLSEAEADVDEIIFALGQKNIPDVLNKPELVERQVSAVENFLQRQGEVDQEFEKFQTQVAAFQGELITSNISDEKKRRLNEESSDCLKLRPTAAQLFEEAPFMAEPNACFAGADRSFRDAAVQHRFWTRVVPSVLFGGFLLGLGIALLVFFRRRQSAKRIAQTQLDIWSEKLGKASERLLDLESKFAGYLSGTKARYVGASAELDVLAADAVNLVFLMYDQSVDIHKQASQVFEDAPIYRARNFEACVNMLTTTPITFEIGLPETQLRVFLPLSQSYEGTAASVLNELDLRYGEAFKRLSSLQSEVDQAMILSTQVQEHHQGAQVATDARLGVGFPVDAYLSELQSIAAEMKPFLRDVKYDPVAANARAGSFLSLIKSLESRVKLGNQCLKTLSDDITPMAQALRAKIATLRAAGWALREPGFDPDGVLDHASVMARELREMLAHYDDSDAPLLRDQILQEVHTASERISITVKARDSVPKRLEELVQSKLGLENRIPEARSALERLASEHAVSAFQVQADNLDELEVVLSEVQAWIQKVEQQFAAEYYLAATADSERCQTVLNAGATLLTEIHHAESNLLALREQARAMRLESEEFLSHSLAKKEALGVGDACRLRLKMLQEWSAEVFKRADEALPDWRRVHGEMQELHKRLAALDAESELGRSSAALAQDQFDTLRTTLNSLSQRVAAEDRDRAHIARFIDQIQLQVSAFAETREDLSHPGEWLADEVSNLQDLTTQAETMWDSERKIIHDATVEHALANDEVKRVDRKHYGFGIKPSLSAAITLLAQAKLASKSREWEEVFAQSQLALQVIRREEKACDRLFRDKEDARIAAAHAVAAAARRQASNSQSSSSSSSNYSSGSSSSSSSSSSWSSSSSGGSSFGSSSSGGSSW